MATMQDLALLQSADADAVKSDRAAIAAGTAKLAADTATESADAVAFAAALQVTGPIAITSADGGSVTVFIPESGTPGFTTTAYPVASTVPVPESGTPAPTPAPPTAPTS